MEKESWQKMQKIDDEIHLAKEKSKTDAEFYKVGKEIPEKRSYICEGYRLYRTVLLKLCESLPCYADPDMFSDLPSIFKIATQTKTFSHKNNEAHSSIAHKLT